jgi:hypothetical protein
LQQDSSFCDFCSELLVLALYITMTVCLQFLFTNGDIHLASQADRSYEPSDTNDPVIAQRDRHELELCQHTTVFNFVNVLIYLKDISMF